LESSERAERASAIGELRTLGNRAGTLLPWLTRQLPQLGAEARAAVLSVLGPLSGGRLDETLRETLSAELENVEPRVREAATWALCDFAEGDAETLRLAQARLEDPEQAVREAAQAVLKTRAGAHVQESPRREAGSSAQAAGAIRALASRCYAALRAGEGNRVFSPLSLFMLLAMVLRGTRSHTEAALRQALHWPWEPASVSGALRGLFEQLRVPASQQSGAPLEEEDEGDALISANGLFAQEGYLREEYLAKLAESFGVAAQVMDFARAPEAAIAAINAWARQQTHGHIPVLVPPGGLSPDNRCVLANAVYFRSRWEEPFDEKDTSEEPFSLLDGQQVDVPMMQRKGTYGYASGPGYQSIELPYRGGQTSMIVLLPETGFFERFERLLTAERLQELLEGIRPEEFVLKLPRFSFEQSVELSAVAEQLGVSAFLAPDADLLGMTQTRERFRGALRHDTRIRVDEKGTVASSISSLFITLGRPREVEVNRPFLFLIRHRASSTVLFLGRVVDPR
jgi:serpin B